MVVIRPTSSGLHSGKGLDIDGELEGEDAGESR